MFGDVAAYQRFMGRWSAVLAPLFVDRVVAGPWPGSVCDVGCGTGNLSAELLRRHPGSRVAGVDPSPPFVAAAAERLGGSRAGFVVGEAERLPLRDGAVGAAFALLVLNFVPDPVAAVGQMRRITVPGGVVGAAVWDYGNGMAMLRVFWEAVAAVRGRPVDAAQDTPFGGGGLGPLLSQAGLLDVVEGLVAVPMRFSSFEDYWAPFLLGAGPAGAHVAGLDDGEREALRSELVRRLGEGPVEMTSTARWARARVPG